MQLVLKELLRVKFLGRLLRLVERRLLQKFSKDVQTRYEIAVILCLLDSEKVRRLVHQKLDQLRQHLQLCLEYYVKLRILKGRIIRVQCVEE